MRCRVALVLVSGLWAVGVAAQGGPTAKIRNGTVRGVKCPATDVNSFLSIPFAKAPVGDRRFAPPEPLGQAFDGTLDATKEAPACPQFNSAFAEWTLQSEDCLFIDVWAPANATADSKLPVRVWLYGGGNAAGGISNPLYQGCYASTNTIQVSINYRVGPLGFLAANSLGLKGNYGIQDQLLGLQWVQENVAAFGGDPAKVVLFGQSAGAADALVISTLPQAKSLFHSVILQSGGGSNLPTLAQASRANEAFIAALNCTTPDLSCLRSVSIDTLNKTAQRFSSLSPSLSLVLDGSTIAAQPAETGPKVPAIIGSTVDEASLFLLAQYQFQALALNATSYYDYLTASFGANASLINQSYPLSAFGGSPNPAFSALARVSTDRTFRCSTRRMLARAAAVGTPVWAYSFGHTPTCSWYAQIPNLEVALRLLASTHTAELPFVFGVVDGLPRPSGTCALTGAERALSATMRAAWDGMAKSAEPGGGWPRWSLAGSEGVNVEGDEWKIGKVDYSMCDFWDTMAGLAPLNTTGAPSSSTGSGGPPPVTVNGAMGETDKLLASVSTGGNAWLLSFLVYVVLI